MSIPARFLEDGQWVTRMLDPYQILAHNRAQEEERVEPTEELKAPVKALITQNLARSSCLKWILPAIIRHSSMNDVVFITEDSVQIKETFQEFPMALVSTKDDMDSQIRNAGVIGNLPGSSDGRSYKSG